MKRTFLITIIAIALLFSAAYIAIAAPVNPELLTKVDSQRGNNSFETRSDNALAGNVTELGISGKIITEGWQGYYGNVSGTIVLDDALNNSMYTWSLTAITGKIYASNVSDINWVTGNIDCINETTLQPENNRVFPGTNQADTDNISNTFSQVSHPAFSVGGQSFSQNQCNYSLSTYVADAVDNSKTFNETLLWSFSNDAAIYMAFLNNNKAGFKTSGVTYDFQMLVGENGHSDTTITPYYFYVELSY